MKARAVRWIDVAAVVAVLLTGLGWLAEARGWLEPAPIENVRDVSVAWDDAPGGTLIVRATYDKTSDDCRLVLPIVVYGSTLGRERVPLEYEPIRRANESAQRFPGEQQMTLRVYADSLIVEAVEVWTRHDCGGQRVDTRMINAPVS